MAELKVTLVKSINSSNKNHCATVKALGLVESVIVSFIRITSRFAGCCTMLPILLRSKKSDGGKTQHETQ
jgi:ribosomal protein L30/L7E